MIRRTVDGRHGLVDILSDARVVTLSGVVHPRPHLMKGHGASLTNLMATEMGLGEMKEIFVTEGTDIENKNAHGENGSKRKIGILSRNPML